jgi:hypothetical protein
MTGKIARRNQELRVGHCCGDLQCSFKSLSSMCEVIGQRTYRRGADPQQCVLDGEAREPHFVTEECDQLVADVRVRAFRRPMDRLCSHFGPWVSQKSRDNVTVASELGERARSLKASRPVTAAAPLLCPFDYPKLAREIGDAVSFSTCEGR